jgi:hypothetical protein
MPLSDQTPQITLVANLRQNSQIFVPSARVTLV